MGRLIGQDLLRTNNVQEVDPIADCGGSQKRKLRYGGPILGPREDKIVLNTLWPLKLGTVLRFWGISTNLILVVDNFLDQKGPKLNTSWQLN